MFSLKNRDYDYLHVSIMNLPKCNIITQGRKCLAYEGAKLWNSVSTITKDAESI